MSSVESRFIKLRTLRTEVADMEYSSSPIPSNNGTMIGSPAASPHIPAHLPSLCAESITCLTSRKMDGLYGWYKYETCSFPRSAAIEYWIKSLVPIEKKSTYLANWSAKTAAAGISIMMPSWMLSETFTPSLTSFSFSSVKIFLACLNSAIVAIIGNIIRKLPKADARNNARSWVRKISWRSRLIRIAR